MRILLLMALLPAPVQAQNAVPPAAPQEKVARPERPSLSVDSPIEAIMADPGGKAVLDAEMPSLRAHPAYEQFKSMSLRQLAPYSGGAITDEKIAAIEAELAADDRPQG